MANSSSHSKPSSRKSFAGSVKASTKKFFFSKFVNARKPKKGASKTPPWLNQEIDWHVAHDLLSSSPPRTTPREKVGREVGPVEELPEEESREPGELGEPDELKRKPSVAFSWVESVFDVQKLKPTSPDETPAVEGVHLVTGPLLINPETSMSMTTLINPEIIMSMTTEVLIGKPSGEKFDVASPISLAEPLE
ncbi:hypothetical protein BDV95DRAFT_222849 [Massariosphaeria phaeospora]|uniref:Uncharacterized protein n=1 Tax=Massariosphaeria phaeospora TaxID=100035 RepID=A0A7C8MVW4_9PLEO|nr:hypothetical protein BDV95DRAFT_222849 [Massariosphaeria phaeospora]